jgi:NitT/TauT family transport system substrate-binding protein
MDTRQRRSTMLICTVLVALLLQACTNTAPEQPATPGTMEVVKLQVVSQPFITFVPFFIALEEGYFAEQGLEVELVNMTVSQEVLPALSSGQVDVSSGLLSSGILNAIARGGNFRIVADKGYIDPQGCENYALVARRDLVEAGAFASATDLRGHTVDVVPATWLEFYLARLLEEEGLSLKDVQTTDLAPPTEPEAFEQRTMALTINSEPWVTRFRKAGHMPVLTPASELLPDTEAAVVMFGPTLMGENADVGNRFMIAYLKAVRQYNDGKTARNIELVSQFTNLDLGLLKEMCWPTLRSDGELNVQGVLDFQTWAVEVGYLDEVVPAEQFWDGNFVAHAKRFLDAGQ